MSYITKDRTMTTALTDSFRVYAIRFALSILFGILLAWPLHGVLLTATGSSGASIMFFISCAIGLLFYTFVSKDVVKGAKTFFGKVFDEKWLEIGSAETEHFSIEAPSGTVFSPIPGLKTEGYSSVAIKDYCLLRTVSGSNHRLYVPQANAVASNTPEVISIRASKSWNYHDPWDDGNNEGHRYREIPYRPSDTHSYWLKTWLRPKSGKRSFGYVIAPILTLVVLIVLNAIPTSTLSGPSATPFTLSNLASVIVILAPFISALITAAEDEPFMRGSLIMLPRACWRITLALAAYGVLFIIPLQEAWHSYFQITVCLLALLSAVNFFWFAYHFYKDTWTDRNDAFRNYDVHFIPMDPATENPYEDYISNSDL